MEKEEIKYYQPKFARWIKSKNWDSIANRLPDTCISIIEKVMNAEKDGEMSKKDVELLNTCSQVEVLKWFVNKWERVKENGN